MVGIDISGRHEEGGEYLMVAAAVNATVGTTRVQRVRGIGFAVSYEQPTLSAIIELVAEALGELPEPADGPVVAERGEFYEEPEWMVEQHLEPEFKYVE